MRHWPFSKNEGTFCIAESGSIGSDFVIALDCRTSNDDPRVVASEWPGGIGAEFSVFSFQCSVFSFQCLRLWILAGALTTLLRPEAATARHSCWVAVLALSTGIRAVPGAPVLSASTATNYARTATRCQNASRRDADDAGRTQSALWPTQFPAAARDKIDLRLPASYMAVVAVRHMSHLVCVSYSSDRKPCLRFWSSVPPYTSGCWEAGGCAEMIRASRRPAVAMKTPSAHAKCSIACGNSRSTWPPTSINTRP